MEYTIKKLADIAGVTTRTLRYYDEIGLLTPKRIKETGYRVYTKMEIDRLQQILFYRELEVGLQEIIEIMMASNFDEIQALMSHHEKLLEKQKHIKDLIKTVEQTILEKKGERKKMGTHEKFENFKKAVVDENTEKYGVEVEKRYGKETLKASNQQHLGMEEDEYKMFLEISQSVLEQLAKVMTTDDMKDEKLLVDLHRQFLLFHWKTVPAESHISLVETYLETPDFVRYYDETAGQGATKRLATAVKRYYQYIPEFDSQKR